MRARSRTPIWSTCAACAAGLLVHELERPAERGLVRGVHVIDEHDGADAEHGGDAVQEPRLCGRPRHGHRRGQVRPQGRELRQQQREVHTDLPAKGALGRALAEPDRA